MRKAMPAQLQLGSANGRTADEYDEVAPFDAKNARRAQSLPKDSVPRRLGDDLRRGHRSDGRNKVRRDARVE